MHIPVKRVLADSHFVEDGYSDEFLTRSPYELWQAELEKVRGAARTVLRMRFAASDKKNAFGPDDYEIDGSEINFGGLCLVARHYYRGGDCDRDEQSVSAQDLNAILMQTPEASAELQKRLQDEAEAAKEMARRQAEDSKRRSEQEQKNRELAQLAALKAKYEKGA